MNEILNALKQRRSCRSFQPRQLAEADLEAILEAGTYAPTGRNLQAPVIVVLQDPERIAQVSRLNARILGADTDPFFGAPTVAIVLADTRIRTWLHDGALVMGNMLNAAHAVGVGGCYIFRAKEVFETPEGRALLESWGLPEHYAGVGNCILGYPTDPNPRPAPPRKPNYILRF